VLAVEVKRGATGAHASRLPRARATPLADVVRECHDRQLISSPEGLPRCAGKRQARRVRSSHYNLSWPDSGFPFKVTIMGEVCPGFSLSLILRL
jgi:hypothetical protein